MILNFIVIHMRRQNRAAILAQFNLGSGIS